MNMTAQKNLSGHKRRSILLDLYLSDGVTLAKDAAAANGVSEVLLRKRLKDGQLPDIAVRPVQKKLNGFERGDYGRPFLPAAEYRFRFLCDLAALPSGEPAWPLAFANGIAEKTFIRRISRDWCPFDAATVPPRCGLPRNDWERFALSNGVSLPSFRARVRFGWSVERAASP